MDVLESISHSEKKKPKEFGVLYTQDLPLDNSNHYLDALKYGFGMVNLLALFFFLSLEMKDNCLLKVMETLSLKGVLIKFASCA